MHKENTNFKGLLFSKPTRGFTIVELIVVIVIIGILSTIAIVSYGGYQKTVAITQLKADLSSAASAMLKVRSFGDSGYPADVNSISTVKVSQNVTLSGGSNDDGKTYCIDAVNSKYPGVSYYIYSIHSGLDAQDGNCASIYFAPAALLATAPVITTSLNGSNVQAVITPSTCSMGTTQYRIRSHINDGLWGDYSDWDTVMSTSQTANDGVKYGYQAQSRCFVSDVSFGESVSGTESIYTDPIPTPVAPVVASPALTVGSLTKWTWTSSACNSGTTIKYQYDYLIDSVSVAPSGWKTPGDPSATSIEFTTITAVHTYTIKVQSQCYSANTASGWSVASNAVNYVRQTPVNVSFAYTGAVQTWTVPTGVSLVTIEAWGSQGGGTAGGLGGYAKGKLAVTVGEVINIYVGRYSGGVAAGYNGGAVGGYFGGGGASDVRQGGTALTNRKIVAGGGGGAGGDAGNYNRGGDGGGTSGGTGTLGSYGIAGAGGSQTAGGTGSIAGSLGLGGTNGNSYGAGGGGGYYGGGGSSGFETPDWCGGACGSGAGGGSSYIGGVTEGITTSGLRSGNGAVTFTN